MKAVIGFLIGVLLTLSVLAVRDFTASVLRRLDRIESFLSHVQVGVGESPQSAPQSHKGELSKPQQWKV